MDIFNKDLLITKMLAGSHAYGTNIATSDVDYRGIFVAPPESIRTPFFPIKEQSDLSEEDTKYYELNQFMRLALDCNPNVLELIWTDIHDVVMTTPEYELLRQHAPDLLSSKIAFTTSGYAHSQLSRIMGHKKWITNPQPDIPPQQIDFCSLVHNFTSDKIFKINLSDYHSGYRLVPYSKNLFGLYEAEGYETYTKNTGSLNTLFEGDTHNLAVPLFIIKFNEDEYNAKNVNWKNYWNWKKNRNAARSQLEEQFGFDTKHALHLVRLLRLGVEALDTGVVNVKRADAKELIEIREGKWSYEELIDYSNKMKEKMDKLYKTTQLRRTPNIKLAAKLILDIQDSIWMKQHN
ncbi:MAG: DNA polymerase beta superfamily protein [Nitrososphaeraceae archaeon]